MQKVWEFSKKETVLCIAGVLAVGSMLLVPPSAAYVGYIDFRVLGLLFCLMTVVAGLQGCGVFTKLAHQVVGRAKSLRSLCRALVLLCFFSSMLITNDVALITFVPFGIMVLSLIGQRSCLIWLVVLQTVAANLGSMLTPFGNPQNLYLYAQYNMGLGRFFALTLPIAALSLVLLLLLVQVIPAEPVQLALQEEATCSDRRRLTGYLVLGVVSILTVFRVLPWQAAVAVVLLWALLLDRPVLRQVDYCLLLTFVCFFVFIGNMGQLEAVRVLVSQVLTGREVVASALLSQVISNVPAAVMLSGFTQEGAALVVGTNIGGLGTLIASLASLISFKFYSRLPDAQSGRYLAVFTAVNFALLILLLPVGVLLEQYISQAVIIIM